MLRLTSRAATPVAVGLVLSVTALVPTRSESHRPAPSPGAPELLVRHVARSLQPGEVVAIDMTAATALGALEVTAFDRRIPVWSDATGRTWQGLVGLDVETAAGPHELRLRGITPDGVEVTSVYVLEVTAKAFAQRRLRVDPRYSEPPASVRPRIEEEARRLDAIFALVSPTPRPVLPLAAPVPQPSSSPFGSRSFFNGIPRSRHNGVDFASPTGTEIRAPAAGRVVLVDDLYFTGNTVVVDHGYGLYSLFAHLERTEAQEGVDVTRGDRIGWVGATGRATGPHLHWSVRLQGARVDPLSLLYDGAAPPAAR